MEYLFLFIYAPNTKQKQREVALNSKDPKESIEFMCDNPCHNKKSYPRDSADCEYQGQQIPHHKSASKQGPEMTPVSASDITYKQREVVQDTKDSKESTVNMCNNPRHQTKSCPRDSAACEYQRQIVQKHKSATRQGPEMTHVSLSDYLHNQYNKRRRGVDQGKTNIAGSIGSRLIPKPRPISWDVSPQDFTARSVCPKSTTHGY